MTVRDKNTKFGTYIGHTNLPMITTATTLAGCIASVFTKGVNPMGQADKYPSCGSSVVLDKL